MRNLFISQITRPLELSPKWQGLEFLWNLSPTLAHKCLIDASGIVATFYSPCPISIKSSKWDTSIVQLSWVPPAQGLSWHYNQAVSWGSSHLKTWSGMKDPLLSSLTWSVGRLQFLCVVALRVSVPPRTMWPSPQSCSARGSMLSQCK